MHIPDLCKVILSDEHSYRQYFEPFKITESQFLSLISSAESDQYRVILVDDRVAGFFMLRGLDEGFVIPSFGVYISSCYANKGLSKLALSYSIAWCIINNIKKIRLSVHPNNIHAIQTYIRAGFDSTGELSQLGHDIYVKQLSK